MERTRLLSSNLPKENESSSPKWWMSGFIASSLLIAGTFLVGRNGFTLRHEENMALIETPGNDMEDYGWYFYKAAFPTKNGSTDEVFRFMSNYTGGISCQKDNLGCDGWKVTCEYGDAGINGYWDRQLHYVHAPRFLSQSVDKDELGVDGWQDVTVQSMEKMDVEFSAFMHNKVQLFILSVAERASMLERNGYKVMRRLSLWKDDKTLLAHASTQVSGKIWEFVGFAPADVTGWEFWSEDECPAAHRVTAEVFKLKASLGSLFETHKNEKSFWISVGVAASTENSRTDMWSDIKDITGAQVTTDSSSSCEVATISYKDTDTALANSRGDQTVMKIVMNSNYQAVTVGGKTYSLKMYEDYIARAHKKYLQPPHGQLRKDRWRNWDHWLDQHVGMKWEESVGCYDKSRSITTALLDKDLPVGKRAVSDDGDHYYVGYSGISMCLEYNTEECHYGIGETDVCACNHENSNLLRYSKSCDNDDQF